MVYDEVSFTSVRTTFAVSPVAKPIFPDFINPDPGKYPNRAVASAEIAYTPKGRKS
ncbi:unnamed protein product [Protopolystoma xenopodis]|uniref:Uncharacterized protein n=1 Tax=Protopolystoma xenopodis TaxID=117903 RepID=A0A3S5BWE6_9PLAT|nr:unnamed protein product [Protopolystoma xenopodis]